MSRYRDGLGVRRMVPQELARLGWGTTAKAGAGKKSQ